MGQNPCRFFSSTGGGLSVLRLFMEGVITGTIRFFDLFSGIGGFREGLNRAGGFTCVGHCEVDAHADKNYRLLFDTEGEWFCDDARAIETGRMPCFDLLCAGFPCQAFSIAGKREGFADARGTLFFEIARLVEARQPAYFLLENVPGLLSHDKGRTFYTILRTFWELGYHVEWKVLNSKDFGIPQSRKRVYIVGYLDGRCAGKILPFPETNGTALIQRVPGCQGKRVYDPNGLSRTLTSGTGGMGGKTGLYEVGVPIKEATRKGYKMAYPGDSIDLGYAGLNSRRGRVGQGIAHTLTTGSQQGTLQFMGASPAGTEARKGGRSVEAPEETRSTITAADRQGNAYHGRIRRLTPRECLRLQGYHDGQIDRIIGDTSDSQLYKQAGNGVTVNVIEAIGRNLREVDAQLKKNAPV